MTQWNTPTFSTASQIAGKVLNQDGTPYTGNTIANLTPNVAGASPGLPGVPYCNVSATTVDVTPLKSQANYVFSFSGNTPMLTIQNVKTAAGTTVSAGPYNLATTDLRTLLGANFMICNYGNSTCGNGATPSGGWNLTGITAFPPGVLWFDGSVTFNGVQGMSRLTNTVLTNGNVTLTSSGMVPLYSPNFSGYSNLCTGSFYPTNLCNKSASPPGLATWTDSSNPADRQHRDRGERRVVHQWLDAQRQRHPRRPGQHLGCHHQHQGLAHHRQQRLKHDHHFPGWHRHRCIGGDHRPEHHQPADDQHGQHERQWQLDPGDGQGAVGAGLLRTRHPVPLCR